MTDNTLDNRSFIVCAWNLRDPNDKIDKPFKEESFTESVKLFVESYGWVFSENENDASLVVLIPRVKDTPISIQEAEMFRFCLPGSPKSVLLVERPGIRKIALPENSLPEWLCILRNKYSIKEFEIKNPKWLMEENSDNHNGKSYPLRLNDITDLADVMINNDCRLKRRKKVKLHKLLSNSGASLLLRKNNTIAKQIWGVLRMSSRYDRLEHDLNRASSNILSGNIEIATNRKKKLLLDTYSDLRSVLTTRQRLLTLGNSKEKPFVILLIDDNPTIIAEKIHHMLKILLPKKRNTSSFKLQVWNPCNDKSKKEEANIANTAAFNALSKYTSLERDSEILNGIWVSEYSKNGLSDEKIESFSLKETDYFLVDLLIDDGLSSKDCGFELIRGLSRLLRDTLDQSKDSRCEIFALSQADDPRKIHAALSAGATGYVLKSRLLSLPAMLAEHFNPISEQVTHLHRNFRLLYTLPNETIRLLRTVTVQKDPVKKPSHESDARTPLESLIDGIPKTDLQDPVNKSDTRTPLEFIVDAIPKTDLHVHVGSCMQTEFLVIASAVMLSHVFSMHVMNKRKITDLTKSIRKLISVWEYKKNKQRTFYFPEKVLIKYIFSEKELMKSLSDKVRDALREGLNGSDRDKDKIIRSVLHRRLNVPDNLSPEDAMKRIDGILDVDMFIFMMGQYIKWKLSKDDIIRLYILYCGEQDELIVSLKHENITSEMRPSQYEEFVSVLKIIGNMFWYNKQATPNYQNPTIELSVSKWYRNRKGCLRALLETGTKSNNLKEYLKGCVFTGAKHLKHPWLMKLYAQQVVVDFIRYGVLYAELRGAPDGYEHIESGFDFKTACAEFTKAIELAQKIAADLYATLVVDSEDSSKDDEWIAGLLGERWKYDTLKGLFGGAHGNVMPMRISGFPVKVGLIFVGKRHKPAFEMIKEAAAVVVHRTQLQDKPTSAIDFAIKGFKKCHVVGFDLAGSETDYPPSIFGDEYKRLSKMHIPITIHAGENASSQFIADAVLELGARRIGHGLSICENPRLMDRLREQRICIELCPVSNHQTCSFVNDSSNTCGREYPLRVLLRNGNAVCLNTDNPIVSDTNMTKECFKASEVYGKEGLSFWELLRIIRMGFINSFMTMPERRAILEIADQIIYNLFSRKDVISILQIAQWNKEK